MTTSNPPDGYYVGLEVARDLVRHYAAERMMRVNYPNPAEEINAALLTAAARIDALLPHKP
jgi:hypothetical protein